MLLERTAPASLPCDPPALLAIARAAHQVGDRDLERAARQLLREHYGIGITFRQAERAKDAP